MKYLIIILWLFFLGNRTTCIAQTQKIDSLKKIGYSNANVNIRVDAFLLLLRQNSSMSVKEFSKIIDDATGLVKQVNTPSVNCKYNYSKAKYYTKVGKVDSALYLLSTTFQKYKAEPSVQHELLLIEHSLANLTVGEGKYKEGIEAMLAVLKKTEEKNDNIVRGYAGNSIGFCFMEMGRYDEAINWFKKVIQRKLLLTEQFDQSSIYDNLASCLNNVGRYDTALILVNQGIEKAIAVGNFTTLANGLNIKADIVINLGKKEKAEPLLMQAIEIRRQIGNADFIASDMAQLSLYYANTGQYEKGINTANEALKIYGDNNLIAKYMFAYEALKLNYRNKGDYKNYAIILEKMLTLKDSLYTINSAEELTGLQTKYEVQKKETLIAQQKLGLFQRNFLLYGAGFLAIISAIFFAYRFKKYQQKQKIIAEQKKIQAELAVKDAEEKERKRIAAELHDNLGVQANAILHNSSLLNVGKENNKNVVEDLQDTAKEMLLNLRETLWAMKASDVTATDLWLRIVNFMKQMSRHYSKINFTLEGTPPSNLIITSTKGLNILLIIQETVNNAVKHAEPKTITAKSVLNKNDWQLLIQDDGKGFDIEKAKQKNDSYGLTNMQERATAANFMYNIESILQKGTTTIISID
ncbi:MAG: histidine kinase [Ferruginibacter sp.]|nr:tetratricopeptide repeat protein [Ferruginibacter sp.]NOU38874.1 tetratricopeptide repeat protein [Ferruginibacter sp.]